MCMSEQAIGNGDTRYHHTTIVATMDAIALLRAVYLSAAAAVSFGCCCASIVRLMER